ncbi:MAG: RNA polymerase subunit sigma-70 [Owenweeksia sp.]|nr:RNA polymerase subunit sigma-70 [Owenweeksia sp.]MBF99507.1 RNA polymerase subunit sigma-70 [Owenweeksia sp.]HBF18523.1 RNA polymerase subunit sigma-70 [Cryomorphaceae bacterium]HCQ14718.1 RNA polymerase subunit sigma-70 [Cryomorphaceae bacterium]
MSEYELISLLQQKDEKAFAELFRQYSGLVYNTALGLVQNQQEAEDLVQEVFVSVLQYVSDFRGDSSLKTWIYRLTISSSLDYLRAQKRQKRGSMFSFLSFRNEESWMHQPDFNHPGVQLENKERASILFKAISQLPENQKVAFTLSKLEDKSYQEIADIMECTVSSVESLLHRARQKLRKLLGKYYEQDRK